MSVSTSSPDAPITSRTAAAMSAAVILAFLAFLLLLAFAPDIDLPTDPGGHALSRSGVGFRGLTELVDEMGGEAPVVRSYAGWETEDLLVVTPDRDTDPDAFRQLLARRAAKPTLLILPKWETVSRPENPGWVASTGLRNTTEITAVVPSAMPKLVRHERSRGLRLATIDVPNHVLRAPADLQALVGKGITPLIEGPGGSSVLGQLGTVPLYVLADPDLLNNRGLADAGNARAMLAILADLNSNGARTITFDVVLNGFERPPNPLRLAFTPPFLAATVCLLVAGLLAGLQAMVRFGPAGGEDRAIAFGKRTLVENAAGLIQRARREHRAGGAYAALTRDLVADATGAPPSLSGDRLLAYLDRLDRTGPRFTALAADAEAATDRTALMSAARALYRWRRSLTVDRR